MKLKDTTNLSILQHDASGQKTGSAPAHNKIKKRIHSVFAVTAAAVLAFAAGCQSAAASSGTSASAEVITVSTEAAAAVKSAVSASTDAYSDRDLDPSYDASEAITVDLSNLTGDYTITDAGVYVLSGTLSGGIIVDAGEDDKVQLVLSGAEIVNSGGPAIYAVSADKLFVTAAEGTVNTLKDGTSYADDSFGNSPDGAIFSRCDLTLNGAGTLNITGSYKFGVVGKDDVVISGLTLAVRSASDGIVGKDSVSIQSGVVTIDSEGDGIVSENEDDTEKGAVRVDGGTLTITTGSADSAKGIKAQASLAINGGSVTIDASDDALHCAGSMTVTDGTLVLRSGDDGMHSDDLIVISGGTITVEESYEGIEAGTITISGGVVDVTASDDGLNAAGGTDSSNVRGGRQTDAFAADSSKSILLSGGTISINASGDGIDSNGTLTVTGGVITVSGPTNSGNGALDAGSSMTISGGVIIAAGASGMAQGFDTSSSQLSLSYTYSSTQQGGTRITLTDSAGNIIVSFAPEKAYQNVIISAPEMQQGETVTLYSGGSVSGGTLSGAQTVGTVTLTGTVTSAGSGASGGGTMPGGGSMPGGGRRG